MAVRDTSENSPVLYHDSDFIGVENPFFRYQSGLNE